MSTLTLITKNYDNSLNISKEPSLQDKFWLAQLCWNSRGLMIQVSLISRSSISRMKSGLIWTVSIFFMEKKWEKK